MIFSGIIPELYGLYFPKKYYFRALITLTTCSNYYY